MKDVKVQDAISNSWVDEHAPLWARPYLRLSRMDRPVGSWLLFLPCAFAAILAGFHASTSLREIVHVFVVCGLGSILMRGAGCTWNDVVDREIDAKVDRTRTRPLPAGQVSVKDALIWMLAQMLIAGGLLLTFRFDVVVLTVMSLVVVAIYPFAKRFTNWPQLVLGIAFNWGVLVAWQQIAGEMTWGSFALYVAMIIWTIHYDTIYAFQDIEDDAMIGVKSSAQAVQNDPKLALLVMEIVMGAALLFAVWEIGHAMLLLPFAMLMCCVEFNRHVFDPDIPQACLKTFRANVWQGIAVMILLMVLAILT